MRSGGPCSPARCHRPGSAGAEQPIPAGPGAHAAAPLIGRPLRPQRAELDFLIFNRIPQEQRQAFFERQVPESSRAGAQIAFGRRHVDPGAVNCPVLSIGASEDNLVSPGIAAALGRLYRGEHLEIEGAGHYALVGEPGWEQTAGHILAWIERLG